MDKHCPGCCDKFETLPASEFNIDKTQPDGLAELCKECVEFKIKSDSIAKKTPITEKKCNTCGKTKPISEFHRKAYNKDGYNGQCKFCKAKYASEWKLGNSITHKEQPKIDVIIEAEPVQFPEEKTKRCGVCGSEKPLSEFTRNKDYAQGRDWMCRQCKNKRQVAYRTRKRLEEKGIIAEQQTEFKAEKKPEPETITRGPKDSAGKTKWSVFPFQEAEFVARVFQKGDQKYGGPFTYRRGIPVDELADAAMRHLIALMSGERVDPESGELHAAHVAANGLMMISQSIMDGEK